MDTTETITATVNVVAQPLVTVGQLWLLVIVATVFFGALSVAVMVPDLIQAIRDLRLTPAGETEAAQLLDGSAR